MRAVVHAMRVMASPRSQRQEPSREAGANLVDRLQPDTVQRLVNRPEHLGDHVTLQSPSTDAMPSRRQVVSRQYRLSIDM
jgi:hypothetical protein